MLARTAPLVRADMRGSGAPVAACTAPCLVYTDGKHTNGLCESAVVTLALAGKACNSFALPPPQPVDVGVLSTDVIVHPDWQTPTSLASSLRQVFVCLVDHHWTVLVLVDGWAYHVDQRERCLFIAQTEERPVGEEWRADHAGIISKVLPAKLRVASPQRRVHPW